MKKTQYKVCATLLIMVFLILGLTGCPVNRCICEDEPTATSLKTPYVGNAPAVSAIVLNLPIPAQSWQQRFMSIGNDFGSGLAPYTLTVYYEPTDPDIPIIQDDMPTSIFEANAALLFALVSNLEEVTFAVRQTPSNNALDSSAYEYHWTITRDYTATTFGLNNWGDLLTENTHIEDLIETLNELRARGAHA